VPCGGRRSLPLPISLYLSLLVSSLLPLSLQIWHGGEEEASVEASSWQVRSRGAGASGQRIRQGGEEEVGVEATTASCVIGSSSWAQKRAHWWAWWATRLGGFFYFLKLLTLAGYITQPPPIIALTEVVFATASVKTTINRDL
jgi:hypothetical protein